MNYANCFASLPDDARVWVYPTSQLVPLKIQQRLLEELHEFFGTWHSHGRGTQGDAIVVEDRFIMIAGVLGGGGPLSGCSIDSVTRFFEDMATSLGISLLSPLMVFYRDSDHRLTVVSRGTFRRLVRAGVVTGDTTVFDLSVTSLGALRGGCFELPMRSSWHARVFRAPAMAELP